MRNPNEAKYFDEEYGCTLNHHCETCSKKIYVPERVMTIHHGKVNVHNKKNLIMSVHNMGFGAQCPECFYEMSNKEMPEGFRSYYE